MKKKGFMDISFGWLFSLIVGAFILFLAIFIAVKLINTEANKTSAEISKDLGIVLDPLETGFEESKTTVLDIGLKSKIFNECDENDSFFGVQEIRTTQNIFGKEQGGDVEISFRNKYIFSENVIEERYFYVFSKRFDFPFKVADLIFIIPQSKTYCFINAPEEITNTTNFLKLDNIINVTGNNCPNHVSERVCFSGGSNCTITVNIGLKRTTKKEGTVYFIDEPTLFASIFADKEIYECQMRRIMRRVESLANLYDQKKQFIESKNCQSPVQLDILASQASSYKNSGDLPALNVIKEDLVNSAKFKECQIW